MMGFLFTRGRGKGGSFVGGLGGAELGENGGCLGRNVWDGWNWVGTSLHRRLLCLDV